ncbi:MAG TPA: PTS sugar transporter subunit IIA [Kiritimatiellae bacterium]|nr:PTS sugar transporter subunit IIA [Kiritimatiellia bacterium]
MKLSEILCENCAIKLKSGTKSEVIRKLCELLAASGIGLDADDLFQAIMAREEIMSTGIGLGIGVPHVRLPAATRMAAAVAVLEQPMEFQSLDDQPVNIVVMIVSPAGTHRQYLKALAHIALILKNTDVRQRLIAARDDRELLEIVKSF